MPSTTLRFFRGALALVSPLPFLLAQTPAQTPAQPTATPPPGRHGMTLEDMARLVRVGSPEVSPDGKWIAYTVSHTEVEDDKSVSQLWMVSWDGTQDVQLTFGKESVGGPKWSPDGRYLAFTSGREGGATKGSQVWVLDRRGGEAQQITNVKDDLGGFRWSPDSKTLLLTIQAKDEPEPEKGKPEKPRPMVIDRFHFKEDREGYLTDLQPHLFLFDIATKKLSKLTSAPAAGTGSFGEENPEWSPDGRRIAFTSNQAQPDPDRVAHSDVFVVAAAPNSAPRKITSFTGRNEAPLAWTPDGGRLVYRQGVAPQYSIYDQSQLMVIDAAGGEPKKLAPKLDNTIGAPEITTDGKAVLASVSEDRVEYLARVPLSGFGDLKRLTPGLGEAYAHDEKANHLALLWTTDATAPEIYALEGEKLRQITHHNDALLASLQLAPTEDLSAKAEDGSEVHALLTYPLNLAPGTKAPLLLWIHGGPTAQDTHGFNVDRQLFATKGYAVLNVNYRGSTGRGHDYSYAINADWGNKEVKDLLASVDAAVATGRIDADHMGVGGWSYGGILTDYTIASTTRFKAASSGAGMGDTIGFYGIDQYILQYENEFGPPWKNLDVYIKTSYPFLHADRIKTPTMFMGGDKDFNVPIQGGEQMYEALRSVGTPAELIVYPGQFHGFSRPSFIKDRYVRWFAWYDHYVKGMSTPATLPAAPPAPLSATPAAAK